MATKTAPDRSDSQPRVLAARILATCQRELTDLGLLPDGQRQRNRGGTRERLLDAAITLFAEHGFDACTMRDLASAVGIKAPAIYNHFESKEQILAEAVNYTLGDFFAAVVRPLPSDSPVAILEHVVRLHVLYQIRHIEIARANDALLNTRVITRVLAKPESMRLVAAQRAYVAFIRDLVRASADDEIHATMSAFAIIALCDRVSSWYRPHGSLKPEEMAEETWRLVRRMVIVKSGRRAR